MNNKSILILGGGAASPPLCKQGKWARA